MFKIVVLARACHSVTPLQFPCIYKIHNCSPAEYPNYLSATVNRDHCLVLWLPKPSSALPQGYALVK